MGTSDACTEFGFSVFSSPISFSSFWHSNGFNFAICFTNFNSHSCLDFELYCIVQSFSPKRFSIIVKSLEAWATLSIVTVTRNTRNKVLFSGFTYIPLSLGAEGFFCACGFNKTVQVFRHCMFFIGYTMTVPIPVSQLIPLFYENSVGKGFNNE